MATSMKIFGPARQLLRARQQEGRLRKAEGHFGLVGPAQEVTITLDLMETGKRLQIELDRAAWEQLRERVDRAFVFAAGDVQRT